MKPADDRAELVRRVLMSLAMAAVGVIVLMFQEEPGAGGPAAAAPQVATTAVAPRHDYVRGERAFPSSATPTEATPCLFPATGNAVQRYRRLSRAPAQADASGIPVLRPSP